MAPALAQKGPAPTRAATLAAPGTTLKDDEFCVAIPSVSTEIEKRQDSAGLINEMFDTLCKHRVDSMKEPVAASEERNVDACPSHTNATENFSKPTPSLSHTSSSKDPK
jgi:hypothetical protein